MFTENTKAAGLPSFYGSHQTRQILENEGVRSPRRPGLYEQNLKPGRGLTPYLPVPRPSCHFPPGDALHSLWEQVQRLPKAPAQAPRGLGLQERKGGRDSNSCSAPHLGRSLALQLREPAEQVCKERNQKQLY